MKNEKEKSKRQNETGITLVALVVTIISIIILSTISMGVLFGEHGLVTEARETKQNTENTIKSQQKELDELKQEYSNSL